MRLSTTLFALAALAGGCASVSDPSLSGSDATHWRSAALGTNHTCAVSDSDGKTYCFGSAERGVLGDAHAHDSTCTANGFRTACRVAPMMIANDPGLVVLSASAVNSCGLTGSGAAWCWGAGDSGMLEFVRDSSTVPVKIAAFAPFQTLTVGTLFACGVARVDATLCWGDNRYGQLGSGSRFSSDTPRVVTPNLHFMSVSAGFTHVCGLSPGGSAYCWGANSSGQLGIASVDTNPHPAPELVRTTQKFSAIEAGGWRTCALASSGAAWCWGAVYYTNRPPPIPGSLPAPVLGGLSFRSISVGSSISCGITSDGSAYCWVDTFEPTAVPGGHRFASIAVGDHHTCGITTDGELWCWGWAHDGQLGQVGFKAICFGSDDSYPCTATPVQVKRP